MWLRVATLVLAGLLGSCAVQFHAPTAHRYQAETRKAYADVLAELELAITEQNFRITGHNKIGSVIREREGRPYPDYDTFQFCNLTTAREILDLSPAAVTWMPCNITARQAGDKVILTTTLLPTDARDGRLNALAARINRQLKQIIDFAVEE
ncbi:DUF302 domain-containing protein [Candidatus Woesearchaeota archaeon]|nr:DUF302 domain-containing protein [Candidatus Woesearchaeota archaeon]